MPTKIFAGPCILPEKEQKSLCRAANGERSASELHQAARLQVLPVLGGDNITRIPESTKHLQASAPPIEARSKFDCRITDWYPTSETLTTTLNLRVGFKPKGLETCLK